MRQRIINYANFCSFQLSGICQSNVHGIFSIRFIAQFACNSLLIIQLVLLCCTRAIMQKFKCARRFLAKLSKLFRSWTYRSKEGQSQLHCELTKAGAVSRELSATGCTENKLNCFFESLHTGESLQKGFGRKGFSENLSEQDCCQRPSMLPAKLIENVHDDAEIPRVIQENLWQKCSLLHQIVKSDFWIF